MNSKTNEAVRYPGYRWSLLVMAWLIVVLILGGQMMISSFSFVLMPELHLTMSQFMLILSAPTMMLIFASLPGGILGDRFGVRLTVGLGAVIVGVSGLLRAFNPSFEFMLTMMCLFGIGFGFILPNLPKVVGIWFPPRQMGIASGIYNTGLSMGATFALATAVPLYGSNWRLGFIVMGIAAIIMGTIWWISARNIPKGVEPPQILPVVPGLIRAVKSKNIWLLSAGMAAFLGVFIGLSGILPHALGQIHDVIPETAALVVAVFTLGMVIGHFIFPLLSDRVGLRKPFIYTGALVCAICLFFGWYTAFSTWTWVLMILGGFALGAVPPLLMAMPVELPEIGHQYVGSAAGIIISMGGAGGFLIPSFLIPALETADMKLTFLVLAIVIGAIAIIAMLLAETGHRTKNLSVPPAR